MVAVLVRVGWLGHWVGLGWVLRAAVGVPVRRFWLGVQLFGSPWVSTMCLMASFLSSCLLSTGGCFMLSNLVKIDLAARELRK